MVDKGVDYWNGHGQVPANVNVNVDANSNEVW